MQKIVIKPALYILLTWIVYFPIVGLTQPVSSSAYGLDFINDSFNRISLTEPQSFEFISNTVSPDDVLTGACDFPAIRPGFRLYCLDANGNLFRISVLTGEVTDLHDVTAFANEGFTGLSQDPVSAVWYAQSVTPDTTGASLYTLDISTGTATRIGPIPSGPGITDIAFDNNGELYGVGIRTNALHRIDKATAQDTIIGDMGYNPNFEQVIDFDPVTNDCYIFALDGISFVHDLRTCDTSDGSTQVIGILGETDPGGFVQISAAAISGPLPEIRAVPVLNTGTMLLLILLLPALAFIARRGQKMAG